MVMILRAIHPDFNHMKDQLPTSHEVPSMDTLIQRMICFPKVPTYETLESPVRVELTVMAATRRGRGPRGGECGGREHSQCTYCKRMCHTQENCYSLHGFPPKLPMSLRLKLPMSQVQQLDTVISSSKYMNNLHL